MGIVVWLTDAGHRANSEPTVHFVRGEYRVWVYGRPFVFHNGTIEDLFADTWSRGKSYSCFANRLSGDYLAIVESPTDIVLFTDQFGLARYYYLSTGDGVVVSDSVQQIKHYLKHPVLSPTGIVSFLSQGYCHYESTYLEPLKKLSPLTAIRYHARNVVPIEGQLPQTCSHGSLIEALSAALTRLREQVGETALSFSGGVDSTALLRLCVENGLEVIPVFGLYCDLDFPQNRRDYAAARLQTRRYGKRLIVLQLNARDRLLEQWHWNINVNPFDFHIALVQHSCAAWCSVNGVGVLLSGQNADSLYNLGNTTYIPLWQAPVTLLKSLSLRGGGLTILAGRHLQTEAVLSRILRGGRLPPWTLWLLRYIYGVSTAQNTLFYARAMGRGYHCLHGPLPYAEDRYISSILTEEGRELYSNYLDDLALQSLTSLEQEPFPQGRRWLLKIKIMNYCQGRDVRCITESSRAHGVRSLLPFSTQPVISYFANTPLGLADVLTPKRELREFVGVRRTERLLPSFNRYSSQELVTVNSELELFDYLYRCLDTSLALSKYVDAAFQMCGREFLDVDRWRAVIAQDAALRLKTAWLGCSLEALGVL